MHNLYWVGPRQSDICDVDYLFNGSITIFGDNKNGNIAYCNDTNRINHNLKNVDCDEFIYEKLKKIINSEPDAHFLFYNQEQAYSFGEDIVQRTLGINNRKLLEYLSDKLKSRSLLSDIADIVPYTALKGNDCLLKNIQERLSDNEYVIQRVISSGGDGTFHINKDCFNIDEEIYKDENCKYIISPYISNSISLNIHAVISEDKILILPGSIQIIYENESKLLYSGADFICYQKLSFSQKKMVNDSSFKICSLLRDYGYRGIIGIDFILQNDKLYFMEINPRFQASSELVNRALKEYHCKSLQELHLLAFENKLIDEDVDIAVRYSNVVYETNNITLSRLKKVVSSSEQICVQTDGYSFNEYKCMDKNVYLCRCIFNKNICSIMNGTLYMQPNIFVEHIKRYLILDNCYNRRNIKFALLNHGVTLTEKAYKFAKTMGNIKKAVFDAIDITIFENVRVNVPFSCNFNSFSPFTIDVYNNELILLLDDHMISKVKIDFIPNKLVDKRTKNGVPFESIINLATDRIRINPAPVCIYKINNLECKFCNLPKQNEKYDIEDIKEVIDYCLENIEFRHFLIGGGTYSLDGGWELIKDITKYIRKKCTKDIYLMTIPPYNISILEELKKAGITEVAFNLEMFDRVLAENIMPGKGKIPIRQYMKCFEQAVKLWGNTGRVRSLLIYGFEKEEKFLKGIEKLCKLGVEPIISIFRPLEQTYFESYAPPSTIEIISLYDKCKEITDKYSLILGPDCTECQNNTLSF